MNSAAPARIFAALLLAASQLAALDRASAQTSPPSAERIESGQLESPGGDVLHYRIRLLPLASFPGLPVPVVAQLSRRDCMIPQSFEAQQPENVVHGAFRAPGSIDWAALCSASGSTTLYVFFAGQLDAPVALRSQPDTAWLGAEPGSSVFGSAWGIATLSVPELRASLHLRQPVPLDHDAIDDARLERSDVIHYFQDGKWLNLRAAN
jgi:hypothetical protein